MRAVLQRVKYAKVTSEGTISGTINKGIVALIGIIPTDDDKVIDYMLEKIINMRIFEDADEKLNLSLLDIKGELLIVPNFTLYGDARKGRRPSYSSAASPKEAEIIFKRLIEKAEKLSLKVQSGVFQTDMSVELNNDGPVTILLDSDKVF